MDVSAMSNLPSISDVHQVHGVGRVDEVDRNAVPGEEALALRDPRGDVVAAAERDGIDGFLTAWRAFVRAPRAATNSSVKNGGKKDAWAAPQVIVFLHSTAAVSN